jgi:hypothetical protein
MVPVNTKPPLTSISAGHRLEAAEGFEPSSRALQAPNYQRETPGQKPCFRIHKTHFGEFLPHRSGNDE